MTDSRTPEILRDSADTIEAEAARWVMRLDREGRTPELGRALDAWLKGDSRRRGALLQARAAFHLATCDSETPATSLATSAPFPEIAPARLTRRAAIFGGASAAIAASFAALALWLPWERYSTATGEVRRVPLADGSVAQINTQSKVAVRLEPEQRIVVLTRGEAWFQVAKDTARPFTVEAGPIRVRAVGTAFSVRRREAEGDAPAGADILVTEGVVEAWATGAEGARIRVAAGERAFVADNAAVEKAPPARAEVDRALAWRNGKIDLAGEPLAHAVAEFNRYNTRKIILAEPALGAERFYGVFRMDDPEGFAHSVHHSLGAPVRIGPEEIRIGS